MKNFASVIYLCDFCDYLWFIFMNWTTLCVRRGAPIDRRNIQGKQTKQHGDIVRWLTTLERISMHIYSNVARHFHPSIWELKLTFSYFFKLKWCRIKGYYLANSSAFSSDVITTCSGTNYREKWNISEYYRQILRMFKYLSFTIIRSRKIKLFVCPKWPKIWRVQIVNNDATY